ncbi:MAG: hypothetical protein ACO1O1_13520 [Adhaeribacter sp.]
MKPEELEDRLADAENVLALHGKRITNLEERKPEPQQIKVPDYYSHFEELKTLVKQHSLAYSSLQIYAQITSFQKTISELPKVLPVEHHHYFEDKSRGFLVGGIGLLLISALSVGLSFGLYRENTRMKENDIKFRMIRQNIPETASWADTIYHRNPEEIERVLKRLEAEQLGIMNGKAQIKRE